MFIFLAMPIIFAIIYQKKSEKTKNILIWVLLGLAMLMTWGIFIYSLFVDENQRLHFWKRLPLHMCSINPILYMIAFGLRNKKPRFSAIMMKYIFYVGSPGALLGLLIPAGDCVNKSFLEYNVYSYWIKHGLIFNIPIILVMLGYYQPKIKDTFIAAGILFCFVVGMYGVNLLFSYFSKLQGINDIVNFFYSREPENFLLEFFWKLIPIELIYMFPLVIIVIPIFLIYYGIYYLCYIVNKKFKLINMQNTYLQRIQMSI